MMCVKVDTNPLDAANFDAKGQDHFNHGLWLQYDGMKVIDGFQRDHLGHIQSINQFIKTWHGEMHFTSFMHACRKHFSDRTQVRIVALAT